MDLQGFFKNQWIIVNNLKMTMKMKSIAAWEDFYLKNQHSTSEKKFESIMNSLGIISLSSRQSVYIDVKQIFIQRRWHSFGCKHNVTISFMPTVICTSSMAVRCRRSQVRAAAYLFNYDFMTFLHAVFWKVAHVFRSSLLIILEFYHEILIAGTTVF